MTTDNGGYISVLIRPNQLQSASDYIISMHTDKWMVWDNCSHLANGIWKVLTGASLDYGGIYPDGLLSAMQESTIYVDETLVTYTDILGYGDDAGSFIQRAANTIEPLQAVDQDVLLSVESYEEYIEYMNVSKDDFTYDQYVDMIVNTHAEETTTSADTQSYTEPGKEEKS